LGWPALGGVHCLRLISNQVTSSCRTALWIVTWVLVPVMRVGPPSCHPPSFCRPLSSPCHCPRPVSSVVDSLSPASDVVPGHPCLSSSRRCVRSPSSLVAVFDRRLVLVLVPVALGVVPGVVSRVFVVLVVSRVFVVVSPSSVIVVVPIASGVVPVILVIVVAVAIDPSLSPLPEVYCVGADIQIQKNC
jgi:hypothetical protein